MEKTDDGSNLLNEIIGFEILPRLSRASLMHLRCFSKSWKSLLTTNPGFWRIHRNFHPHNTAGHLLLHALGSGPFQTRTDYLVLVKASQEGDTPSHITDLVKLPCPLSIIRCANGLVLGHRGWINDPIYIFNPFTRESVIVPYPTFQYADLSIGFSPSTNEYKVVATQETAGLVGFKIFTLGQASWRNIAVDWHHLSFVHPPTSDFSKSTVCLHGALHWLAPSDEAIYALDIGDERLRIIEVPSQCKLLESYKRIIEVDKCLCIVCGNNRVDELMLWILKDCKNQVWVAETIKFPYLSHRISLLPRCTTYTGELVFGLCQDNHLQLYDRKSKSCRWSEIISPKMLRDLGLRLDFSVVISFDDCIVPLQ